ncbi:Rossmann fold nucleotide-binding protein [Pedococcus sp.]|jgi:predicted Rossmann-fold nucleotide-binding protein|uniref:LOG family protein n=1 Tax=Pedococcus sp. TaxID=2860345 RepID=UPI002E1643D7|nr:Rossmann fold nucleotide-binding protein [Pedococcus sp.]
MDAARRSSASSRPVTEIESLKDLDSALASGKPLTGLRLQDLDLTAYETPLLRRTDVEGLVVLGGRLPPALDAHLRAHRALIFPTDPAAPVDPYRATLYSPDELYAGLAQHGYEATPDFLAYQWMLDAAVHRDAFVTLLRAIHDDSMTDALDELTEGRPVVGVMGGHDLGRDTSGYAAAARLGHALASAGFVVATGGGPGAMEAANLGALAADPGTLVSALGRLATVPTFRPSVRDWAMLAFDVRRDLVPSSTPRSIGIPTWFYGHEPPNVFCDGIGKYFSNAIREDGLLARSTAGLVVLEGAAGTVQEIFQAVTPLFYAAPGARLAPLVLVGRRHWTVTVPVWPAVQALGRRRPFGQVVQLVDTVEEATTIVVDGRSAVDAPE